jgi:hypothetical protein
LLYAFDLIELNGDDLRTQGLRLPLRPLARLAQNEELGCTGGEARRGGRMGQEQTAMISASDYYTKIVALDMLVEPDAGLGLGHDRCEIGLADLKRIASLILPRLMLQRLRDVLKPRNTVIDYTYDFGDCWEHLPDHANRSGDIRDK